MRYYLLAVGFLFGIPPLMILDAKLICWMCSFAPDVAAGWTTVAAVAGAILGVGGAAAAMIAKAER